MGAPKGPIQAWRRWRKAATSARTAPSRLACHAVSPPLAAATDPDGRLVVLDEEGWGHILAAHPAMATHQEAVLAAVAGPDHRAPDPRPGYERYFRQGVGPGRRWLRVVVDFSGDTGYVVTSFPQRRAPSGWSRFSGST
jgi:hypothetical protein